jgi:NADH:ubiquinone oxidoreductase subunit 6 (subunit J)
MTDTDRWNSQSVVFYFSPPSCCSAALRVITARNPVHAALALVLAFFTAAGIWLLLEAEFLAITLVLVYVGAVMVLFLFVVMMLDINLEEMRRGFWSSLPRAGLVAGLMVVEMVMVLGGQSFGLIEPRPSRPISTAIPRSWVDCSTPITSTLSSWRPCSCWWPWWRPSP